MTLMINGFNSSKAGGWVGGIRLRTIDYATVYFTKDTPKFRGVDLTWYGPFKAGDAQRIPSDDADFQISKGYASYTPPTPGLATIAQTLSGMSTDLASVKTNVSALSGSVGIVEIVVILEAIAIIALALVLFRKKT